MSFFDDNRKVGLALIIIGIINIIAAVALVIIGFMDDNVNTGAAIVLAVGGFITGILLFMFGQNVRNGSNDKVAIVSGLVRVIGIITIISAFFTAIASALMDNIGGGIASAIISIIIGLILLWIAAKIAGKDKNVLSKIIWVLLVVVSLILMIIYFIGIFAILSGDVLQILEGVQNICWFFVAAYLFLAALSPEVKSAMGI